MSQIIIDVNDEILCKTKDKTWYLKLSITIDSHLADTTKRQSDRLKEEARIKAEEAAESERLRKEEERKRKEEEARRIEAERQVQEERMKVEEAERKLAEEAMNRMRLPFNFAKLQQTFKCEKCNMEIEVKTIGKLQKGMQTIFVYDQTKGDNKFVYAHYS